MDDLGCSELASEAADRRLHRLAEGVGILVPGSLEELLGADRARAGLEQRFEDAELLGRELELSSVAIGRAGDRVEGDPRRAQGAAVGRGLPARERSDSASGSRTLELLAIAKCMRKHGVADFPDPSSSPPSPKDGNAIGANGVYLSVGPPASEQSPAFKRAAAACRLP